MARRDRSSGLPVWERLLQSKRQPSTDLDLVETLALLGLEERTCVLTLRSGNREGWLGFAQGALVGATSPGADGIEAVQEILAWPAPELRLAGVVMPATHLIRAPLSQLLPTTFAPTNGHAQPTNGVAASVPSEPIDWESLGLPPPDEAFEWVEAEPATPEPAKSSPADGDAPPLTLFAIAPEEATPADDVMFAPVIELRDDELDWDGLGIVPPAEAFNWVEPATTACPPTALGPAETVPLVAESVATTPNAAEASPTVEPPRRPSPEAIRTALGRASDLAGFLAGAAVDGRDASVLEAVVAPVAGESLDLAIAVRGSARLIELERATVARLGIAEAVEEILIGHSAHYHLVRPLPNAPDVHLHFVFARSRVNLALARQGLGQIVESLA